MTAMPTAQANGIEIVYDTFGDAADPTVLLVMGLGARWSTGREFCQGIADRGFHVVRYDNRDVGESTCFDSPVDVGALLAARSAGETPDVPYLLGDMADAVGVLDHLGIDTAHVFGVSMGGMIVQTLAIEHPDRRHPHVGDVDHRRPRRGQPDRRGHGPLMSPPAAAGRSSRTRRAARPSAAAPACTTRTSCGPPPPRPGTVATTRSTARQLAAILASGSRSPALAEVGLPALVIHGAADTLIHPSGGERTAEVIPDAKLVVIDGMGHDLPRPLWPQITDLLVDHARGNG